MRKLVGIIKTPFGYRGAVFEGRRLVCVGVRVWNNRNSATVDAFGWVDSTR